MYDDAYVSLRYLAYDGTAQANELGQQFAQ